MRKLLVLMLVCSSAFATKHYVAASGGVGSGSALTPGTAWTFAYAIYDTSNVAHATGDTIIIQSGTYDLTSRSGLSARTTYIRGASSASKLVIKGEWTGPYRTSIITASDSTWELIIHAGLGTGAWTANGGGNVIWQDLVFQNTSIPNSAEYYGGSLFMIGGNDSVWCSGIEIRGCVLRNSPVTAIADNAEAKGAKYEWNLIMYNGRKEDNTNYGYAFYDQSHPGSGWKYILDNILLNQWGRTAQSYGSSATYVDSLYISRNLIVQYPNTDDANAQWLFSAQRTGGTNGLVFSNNWFFSECVEGSEPWQTLYKEEKSTHYANVDSNWFMAGRIETDASTDNRNFRYNRGYTYGTHVTTDTTGWAAAGNVYTEGVSTMPAWAETVIVRMRPDSIAYGKYVGNMMVYNANAGATQAWNPTGILTSGDSVYLIDAQNPDSTVLSTLWTSGSINVPMIDTDGIVEAPVSIPDSPTDKNPFTHTDSRVGTYIVYTVSNTSPPAAKTYTRKLKVKKD